VVVVSTGSVAFVFRRRADLHHIMRFSSFSSSSLKALLSLYYFRLSFVAALAGSRLAPYTLFTATHAESSSCVRTRTYVSVFTCVASDWLPVESSHGGHRAGAGPADSREQPEHGLPREYAILAANSSKYASSNNNSSSSNHNKKRHCHPGTAAVIIHECARTPHGVGWREIPLAVACLSSCVWRC
jgi:hypothetical protein